MEASQVHNTAKGAAVSGPARRGWTDGLTSLAWLGRSRQINLPPVDITPAHIERLHGTVEPVFKADGWEELCSTPLLDGFVQSVHVRFRWHDQGWGNEGRGDMRLALVRPSPEGADEVVGTASPFGKAVHDEKAIDLTIGQESLVVNDARPRDRLVVQCFSSGSSHTVTVKDFHATVALSRNLQVSKQLRATPDDVLLALSESFPEHLGRLVPEKMHGAVHKAFLKHMGKRGTIETSQDHLGRALDELGLARSGAAELEGLVRRACETSRGKPTPTDINLPRFVMCVSFALRKRREWRAPVVDLAVELSGEDASFDSLSLVLVNFLQVLAIVSDPDMFAWPSAWVDSFGWLRFLLLLDVNSTLSLDSDFALAASTVVRLLLPVLILARAYYMTTVFGDARYREWKRTYVTEWRTRGKRRYAAALALVAVVGVVGIALGASGNGWEVAAVALALLALWACKAAHLVAVKKLHRRISLNSAAGVDDEFQHHDQWVTLELTGLNLLYLAVFVTALNALVDGIDSGIAALKVVCWVLVPFYTLVPCLVFVLITRRAHAEVCHAAGADARVLGDRFVYGGLLELRLAANPFRSTVDPYVSAFHWMGLESLVEKASLVFVVAFVPRVAALVIVTVGLVLGTLPFVVYSPYLGRSENLLALGSRLSNSLLMLLVVVVEAESSAEDAVGVATIVTSVLAGIVWVRVIATRATDLADTALAAWHGSKWGRSTEADVRAMDTARIVRFFVKHPNLLHEVLLQQHRVWILRHHRPAAWKLPWQEEMLDLRGVGVGEADAPHLEQLLLQRPGMRSLRMGGEEQLLWHEGKGTVGAGPELGRVVGAHLARSRACVLEGMGVDEAIVRNLRAAATDGGDEAKVAREFFAVDFEQKRLGVMSSDSNANLSAFAAAVCVEMWRACGQVPNLVFKGTTLPGALVEAIHEAVGGRGSDRPVQNVLMIECDVAPTHAPRVFQAVEAYLKQRKDVGPAQEDGGVRVLLTYPPASAELCRAHDSPHPLDPCLAAIAALLATAMDGARRVPVVAHLSVDAVALHEAATSQGVEFPELVSQDAVGSLLDFVAQAVAQGNAQTRFSVHLRVPVGDANVARLKALAKVAGVSPVLGKKIADESPLKGMRAGLDLSFKPPPVVVAVEGQEGP